LVRRVREICLGAYAHQDVPFEKLVDELQPERGLSRHPLFQVSFNLQNAPLEVLELPGLSISKFSDGSEATQFDLSLEIREVEGSLRGLIQYNTDIFEADTIERITAHFKTLLTAVAGAPEQRLSQLPILTTDERRQLLVEWNDTPRELSIRQCIHQAFEAQAERTPDSAAVVFNDERLSYRELNERANRLARQLLDRGVEPETRIGLCVRRSAEMIVALLGILKAGGTYVPLDPSYPRERLAFMIEDARVSVLLTETAVIDALPLEHRARVVLLDVGPDADAVLSTENPARELRPGNLAYVIYTSGSTGTPKGIGVTHEVAVNHISAIRERFGIEADDRVLQFASLSFDVSVEQILTALLTGATSVLRGDELWSAADFTEQLEAQALTVVNFPTAYWHQLARECVTGDSLTSRHGLKLVIIGGDMILPEAVRAWQSTPMNGVRLLNAYGPTETAITASTFDVPAGLYDGEEKTLRRVPIGRPVNLRAVYVLDKHGNLSPVGVPGELYIGGPLLARGYLNKSDLTAERFVPDPFGTRPGARMYRTGDLVRRMRDGQLEFLGRVDNQVKVRGFRIELGEIEAVLGRHEGVFEAVVEARREDAASEKQLVAYLVPREADAFALEDVRSYLQEKLPAYMQPSAFVLLERLLLTPNGKVDRRALPAPDFNRAAPEREEATPRTHAEQTLSDIWREVLGLERVGVHDNFFEVGGDSILSLQIIAKAQGAGLRLTPKQIFDRPTVAELAAVAGEVALAEQDAVRGEVPLTPIQRRFFEQNPDRPNHFNQSILLETRQPIEPALMERAVRHLHLHHDALRLRFTRGDGWRQFNHGVEAVQADFTRVDFSHLTEAELKSAIETEAENVQRSLDVESGPLVRVVLFDLGAGRPGRLLLVIHHLVVDGVSWRILLEDLQRLYAQSSRGERLELAPKTASFKNWAERLSQYARAASQKEELAYWLASSRQETGRLPVEIDEGPNTEASAQTVTWALGEDETRALLQEVPRAYRTQINDVLLAALAQTLAVWTGGRRVLVDLEGHGREEIFENVDLSRTVGWFTSIFPVLLDAGNDPQPGDLLKSVKEQLRAIPQRGIGYGLLRYLSGDAEAAMKLRALPQAEVVFNYLGQFDQTLGETSMFGFAAESGGRERRGDAPRGHLLEINASVAAGQLRVNWTYGEQVFRRETVTQLAADFGSALRALVAHCLSAEAGGLTPSDFPLAKLEQRTLDRLLETQTAVEDIYRLSPTQDGILFHTLFAPEANEYHGQLAWTLGGVVDVAALERAWRQVLERHPALRTSFVWHGVEQPLQIVHKGVGLPVEQLDWRALSTPEQEARFESFLGEDRARGLDLTEAPLMRLTLVRLTDESYRFVWSHHHLLLDGWSR
ncbi:MAG TPA: amino acid adenylation domain-containing protein, partial [Pyrinomonadaceae bacterium]|nr:amino acid adenylation domain-containing protein [Pyrinomonadaceae bacterium]